MNPQKTGAPLQENLRGALIEVAALQANDMMADMVNDVVGAIINGQAPLQLPDIPELPPEAQQAVNDARTSIEATGNLKEDLEEEYDREQKETADWVNDQDAEVESELDLAEDLDNAPDPDDPGAQQSQQEQQGTKSVPTPKPTPQG